jgi:hypothetical protein
MYVKLKKQPTTVGGALVLAEAHLRVLGRSDLSPLEFVRNCQAGEVTAAIVPLTKLREQEVLPGLKLKSGASVLEVVRIIPTNREVVYKNNRGGLFRMPTAKFVRLALQQGYKKVWNIRNFLISLKTLLKPVMDALPLMWVLKFVLGALRRKPGVQFSSKLPKHTEKL